jgi:threonine synthase
MTFAWCSTDNACDTGSAASVWLAEEHRDMGVEIDSVGNTLQASIAHAGRRPGFAVFVGRGVSSVARVES